MKLSVNLRNALWLVLLTITTVTILLWMQPYAQHAVGRVIESTGRTVRIWMEFNRVVLVRPSETSDANCLAGWSSLASQCELEPTDDRDEVMRRLTFPGNYHLELASYDFVNSYEDRQTLHGAIMYAQGKYEMWTHGLCDKSPDEQVERLEKINRAVYESDRRNESDNPRHDLYTIDSIREGCAMMERNMRYTAIISSILDAFDDADPTLK